MKTRRYFLKLAGAAIVGVTNIASANKNPFGFVKMKSGYRQVATEGNSGTDKKMQGTYGGNQVEGTQPEGAVDGNEKPRDTHIENKETEISCGGYKEPEAACGILKNLQDSCGAKLEPKVKEDKFNTQG